MLNIVKHADMFGSEFQMTIFKSSKFKTVTGGCTSIISIVLVIVSCFFFGKDFLYKQNPRVLTQIVIPNDYADPIQITSQNLAIPWRLTDNEGKSVNFTNLFYPVMTYYRYEFNSSGQFLTYLQNLEYVKCNSKNAKDPQLSKNFKLDEYYCVNWDDYNLTLGGYWDGSFIHSFDLLIYFCPKGQPFSPEANCTDISTVKDYLGKKAYTVFEILYPEYNFSPEDLENPLKINYKLYFYNLDMNIQKADRLYFKQVLLEDDNGWIFEDTKNKTMSVSSDLKYEYNLFSDSSYGKEGGNSDFYGMNFYYQKNYDKIHRSYMKFQDLASIIGGFIKIVGFFGTIFTFLLNQFTRDEMIYNEFFQFIKERNISLSDSKSKKIVKNTFKIDCIQDLNRDRISLTRNIVKIPPKFDLVKKFATQININNNLNNNNLNIIEIKHSNSNNVSKGLLPVQEQCHDIPQTLNLKYENMNRNSIKFGFWFSLIRYVCFCFNFKSRKSRIYKFLTNYFEEKLDVIHYLKTLESVDGIKSLLFNDYQKHCFEFLKIPNLLNESELESLEKELNKTTVIKFNELINYFTQKSRRKEISKNDEKLLSMINSQIVDLSLTN